jgi:hypothetical protein
MIARGLEPQMPTDAAKLFPDLFSSRNVAKQAYHRDRLRAGQGRAGPRPYREDSIRRCNQPPRDAFFYQPAGRGQLPRFCMADAGKVPDVRMVLERALGPLAKFEKV